MDRARLLYEIERSLRRNHFKVHQIVTDSSPKARLLATLRVSRWGGFNQNFDELPRILKPAMKRFGEFIVQVRGNRVENRVQQYHMDIDIIKISERKWKG